MAFVVNRITNCLCLGLFSFTACTCALSRPCFLVNPFSNQLFLVLFFIWWVSVAPPSHTAQKRVYLISFSLSSVTFGLSNWNDTNFGQSISLIYSTLLHRFYFEIETKIIEKFPILFGPVAVSAAAQAQAAVHAPSPRCHRHKIASLKSNNSINSTFRNARYSICYFTRCLVGGNGTLAMVQWQWQHHHWKQTNKSRTKSNPIVSSRCDVQATGHWRRWRAAKQRETIQNPFGGVQPILIVT